MSGSTCATVVSDLHFRLTLDSVVRRRRRPGHDHREETECMRALAMAVLPTVEASLKEPLAALGLRPSSGRTPHDRNTHTLHWEPASDISVQVAGEWHSLASQDPSARGRTTHSMRPRRFSLQLQLGSTPPDFESTRNTIERMFHRTLNAIDWNKLNLNADDPSGDLWPAPPPSP